ARVDRAHQMRPYELRREPDERGERDRLHDQREIDVHGCPVAVRMAGRPARYLSPGGISGLPNANSIARPTPMMNDASIRPSSRNTLACSWGISSGWRAAPSRNREHMMPTPTQAPSAPSPMMSPMPTPVRPWIMANACILSILLSFLNGGLFCVERNELRAFQWCSCAIAT